MKWLKLLMVLAVASGANQSEKALGAEEKVREALAAHYARMDAAIVAGRFDEIEAAALPDAIVRQGSHETPFSTLVGHMREMMRTMAVVSHRASIESLRVQGEEARVIVRTESVVRAAGQDRTGVQKSEDTWLLTRDGWRLKRSVALGAGEVATTASAWNAAAVARDLRQYAHATEDLRAFDLAVGDARIVGLGEATHGTEEIAASKARLVEHLVRDKGFGVLAIEGHWAGALRLDEYINGGAVDADAALAHMGWHLASRRMRTLLDTLRAFNRDSPGSVRIAGFDMVWGDSARQYVTRFISKTLPDQLQTVEQWYAPVRSLRPGSLNPGAGEASSSARRVIELLDRLRPGIVEAVGETEWRRARHAAEIVSQATSYLVGGQRPDYREQMMARNVEWLEVTEFPGRKMVLWAHNSHLSSWKDVGASPMGSWLRERYGSGYYAVGYAVAGGEVRAHGKRGLSTYAMPLAAGGSGDGVFAQVGLAAFFLNMRQLPNGSPSLAWLGEPRSYYSVGGAWNEEMPIANTAVFPLAKSFDGVIFFRETHAVEVN